jgi:hypothetical protein
MFILTIVEQSLVLIPRRNILTQLLTVSGLPLPEGFASIPSEHDRTSMFSSSSSHSLYSNLPSSHNDDSYRIYNGNEHKHSGVGPFAEEDWESVWREIEQVGGNPGHLMSSRLMRQQNDRNTGLHGNMSTDPAFEMLHTVLPEVDNPYTVSDVLGTDDLEQWFRPEPKFHQVCQ